jgi:hypothetical protein
LTRRLFALATSLPAMAFLTCALLVDPLLLPRESACCLFRGTRRGDPTSGVYLAREQGKLHAVFSDEVQTVGVATVYMRESPEPCLWAPVVKTLRVEIRPWLNDGTVATRADLESVGADVANRLAGRGAQSGHIALLRRGGGFERRLLPVGCAHNLAASAAALVIVCGVIRGARGELRSYNERRRLGQNECPRCGYSRTGGPPGPCPECGRP